jgi:peptidoglycan hydrolase-like amidase
MGYLRAFIALSVAFATFLSPGLSTAQIDAGAELGDAAAETAGAPVPQTVTFVGGGFGHTVGMSQYGAQGRALAGFTGEEIVTAYYTGTDVEATSTLPLDPEVLGVERPLWVGLSQGHHSLPLRVTSGDLTICFDAECVASLTATQGDLWVITYDGTRGGCTFTRNGDEVLLPDPPPPDNVVVDEPGSPPIEADTPVENEPAPTDAPPETDPAPGTEEQPPTEDTTAQEPPAETPTEDTTEQEPPAETPTEEIAEEEEPPPPEPVVAPLCRLTIELDPGRVTTLDKEYGRGALEIRKVPGIPRFHVSASLSLDDYVYGISEVPTSWHPEALAAQALASRTYATNRFLSYEDVNRRLPGEPGLTTGRQADCWCHVVDTTADQVYDGLEAEAASWLAAADATASRVITYRGADAAGFTKANVIVATYSSSNGGVSESNTTGFGSNTLYPYLVPVDDPYSIIEAVNNPLATWEAEFDVATVLEEIGTIDGEGPAWESLITAQVVDGPPGGSVHFEGIDRGEFVTQDVPGWQIRRAFGLRSPQVFDVKLSGAVCAGHFPTIVGSRFSEHIVGTYGKDVIVGYGGDDTIEGLGGDDVICAGTGNDLVNGGFGADTILGGAGSDTLYGDQSHDVISGGDGQDYIDGGFGDDTLNGDRALDIIHGGGGRDLLKGGAGDNVLYGDAGRDILQGGPDDDRLFGGAHGDKLSGYGGDDKLDGGTENDKCFGGQGVDTATDCEVVTWVP